jgi:HSP20 family protein
MALVRWSPFQELADMRREMQSLGTLMTSRLIPFIGEDRFIPAMDVTTRGNDLVVRVELPGVDLDKDVDVSIEEGMLRVAGKRTAEREEEKPGYHFREMRYGSFERSIPLPEGTRDDAINAEYKDGILEVKVVGGAKEMVAPEHKKIPIHRVEGAALESGSGEHSE